MEGEEKRGNACGGDADLIQRIDAMLLMVYRGHEFKCNEREAGSPSFRIQKSVQVTKCMQENV